MPFLELPTHRLHYRIDGAEHRPWLTLCNSLGTDLGMWDAQVEALGAHFRLLRYDRRGHGRSSAPPPPFRIRDLGEDVLALLDALGIARTHFCGLSIGGLTGQWLGLEAAARLDRLVVCSTAARIGDAESWHARIAQVEQAGLAPLVPGTRERWFTPGFAQTHGQEVNRVLDRFAETSPEAYIGCCHALADADLRERLPGLALPLLALAGSDDPVTPPDALRRIADRVADGRYAEVPGRHLCNVESPEAFAASVLDFLRA